MTLDELITFAREARLDDSALPYRWSDATLVRFFNEAEKEACRRANLIIDKKTDLYCRVALVAGNPRYTVNAKVLKVLAADLSAKTRGALTWTASTKTLSDPLSRFVLSGFVAGDRVRIDGFTNAANNGIFTTNSVAAGAIVVDDSTDEDGATVVLVNETATDAIIETQKKELTKVTSFALDEVSPGWNIQQGEPSAYIQEENNELIVVPIPDDPGVLSLTVVRLPAADMILADRTTDSPEIPEEYHLDLVDWVCHLAYQFGDTDAEDLKRSQIFEEIFTGKFGPRPSARREKMRKRYPRELIARPRRFGY